MIAAMTPHPLTIIAAFILAAASPLAGAFRPNIILILSDDQDWNGLSVQMHPDMPNSKSDFYRTPNLEKFATQAMRFSNGYAPAPVCSPTRISLQTGMNPARLGWTKAAPPETGQKLIEGTSRKAIRDDEVTIAEVLKRAGYATAHFGKWHLSGGGPEKHGYDVTDGDTGNRDADPFVDPNPVDIFGMTTRASAFMAKQTKEEKPFYLQMSYYALHLPGNALKSTREFYDQQAPGKMHKDPARAAITTDLDTGVGRLLESVDKLGISSNTYVIYMGDNGGGGGGGKGGDVRPLRAGKGGVWEGGIRVPFIIRGPGIRANSWCHQPVTGYDLFPTICHWAGVKEKPPVDLDGGDLSGVLAGGDDPVIRQRDGLVFHFPHYQGDTPHSAIRSGNYKLLKFYESGERLLYDLEKDPGEKNNLAPAMKDVADRLEMLLARDLKEYGATMPRPNPDYDPSSPSPTKQQRKGGANGQKGGRKDKS
jgi:arylsulfatase A-like enzyme